MKKLVTSFALAALALTGVAQADLCTIEATPAATLLLPYFEVDIDDPNGIDTFLSVNNAREYAVLGHVIVWTDMSVEALDFNIFLTGYDVQTIGMGLIIRNGILPETAWDSDVSPVGAYSVDDGPVLYDACAAVLPYTNPALDADFLEHLQSILTGGPSSIYNGLCGGADYGDNIARGYVTIDNVVDCTLKTPCDPGYFVVTGATDFVGGYENAFWGDWYMVDYANDFAQGDTLVHIEATQEVQPGLTAVEQLARVQALEGTRGLVEPGIGFGLGGATFWGRCATDFDFNVVLDFREPLASTFASRYYQNAAFTGGTDLLVWRDSLFNVLFGDEDGFSCSLGPNWFPLNERQVVFFDEQENPEAVCTVSPCPEEDILFPIEAQRVSVSDLEVTPESGWVYMNLNQLWLVGGEPVVFAGQAWVNAVHSAEGRFSAGLPAIQLDSVCDFSSVLIGPEGDGFPTDEGSDSSNYLGFYTYGFQTAPAAERGSAAPANVLP
jgi:hypothetical protein